jgi:hypothetical protein
MTQSRLILRWIRLVFSFPLVGCCHSPFEQLPDYAPVVRFVAFPVIALSDYGWGTSCPVATGGKKTGVKRSAQRKEFFMKNAKTKNTLSPAQRDELLETLKARFEKNMSRHAGFAWPKVKARLEAAPEKFWSLGEMENTGGEPDVVGHDQKTGEYLFVDCCAQSPEARASLCYDRDALESRKKFKPKNNALDVAAAMGVELLTEKEYGELQQLGEFDTKSSSWLKTPPEIRKLGGALFGDRRFGRVFTYHNGAESYYSGRGFRGVLKV